MGYLDGSTITVDAVLTKQGRKLLAQGQSLGIQGFCLSDTGIDYNLWNTGHPSGSAYYGEAIEELPQTEASPQGEYFMRNKLVTLPKDSTALPLLQLEEPSAFEAGTIATGANVREWRVTTANFTQPENYWVICPNRQFLHPLAGAWRDISGVSHQFIAEADIHSAGAMLLTPAANRWATVSFNPAATDTAYSTTLTFVGEVTGTYKTTSNIIVPVTQTKIKLKGARG
jgi:hypothetical protein